MEEKLFAVYILTNTYHTVLYTGVTSDLRARMVQHREGLIDGFAKKYHCKILLHYQTTGSAEAAIAREKEIKGWSRVKKEVIITMQNPSWEDLYESIW